MKQVRPAAHFRNFLKQAFIQRNAVCSNGRQQVAAIAGSLRNFVHEEFRNYEECIKHAVRGECGVRQVKNPEVGLVSQQGGILTTHATMLLSLDGGK